MSTIVPCRFTYGDPADIPTRLAMVVNIVEQLHPNSTFLIQVNHSQLAAALPVCIDHQIPLETNGGVLANEMWAVVE